MLKITCSQYTGIKFLFSLLFFQSYSLEDVIGCFIDLGSSNIKFSKNGIDLGKAFDIPGHMRNAAFFPTVCLKVRTRNEWQDLNLISG